jgi:hypothetical protein
MNAILEAALAGEARKISIGSSRFAPSSLKGSIGLGLTLRAIGSHCAPAATGGERGDSASIRIS